MSDGAGMVRIRIVVVVPDLARNKNARGGRWCHRERMHHRRTVGLDIPCQVALLQSLTPLLQAKAHCTLAKDVAQPSSK